MTHSTFWNLLAFTQNNKDCLVVKAVDDSADGKDIYIGKYMTKAERYHAIEGTLGNRLFLVHKFIPPNQFEIIIYDHKSNELFRQNMATAFGVFIINRCASGSYLRIHPSVEIPTSTLAPGYLPTTSIAIK